MKCKVLSHRAQVGMEFMIIIGAVMFFTSLLLLIIQQDTSKESYKKENILLKNIALTVQNEVNLAMESGDGYVREFNLPKKAGNLDYEITIDNKMIYIKTIPFRHALAVPSPEIVGNINKTYNIIKKISGVVYLN